MKSDKDLNTMRRVWEKTLDHALKNLPEKQAPEDLLPQVLLRIQAKSERIRQRRLWWYWPLWIRIPATALSLAIIIVFLLLADHVFSTNIIPTLHYTFEACRTALDAMIGVLVGTRVVIEDNYIHYSLLASSILLAGIYVIYISVGTFIYRTVRR